MSQSAGENLITCLKSTFIDPNKDTVPASVWLSRLTEKQNETYQREDFFVCFFCFKHQTPPVSINVGTVSEVPVKVSTCVQPVLGSCVRVCSHLEPPEEADNKPYLFLITWLRKMLHSMSN